MDINRDRPRILITTKSTGRITHQIFIGDFSFDRRSVKPDGTAFFKCKERTCGAMIRAKYSSKEGSLSYEKPLIVKIPTTEGHVLSNGQPHMPNPAERLVRETRQIIQETMKQDTTKTVKQVFDDCFESAINTIAQQEDAQVLSDFKKMMPSKVQMERSMYRWKKGVEPGGTPYSYKREKGGGEMKGEEEDDNSFDNFFGDYVAPKNVKNVKDEAANFDIKQELDSGGEDDWDRLLEPDDFSTNHGPNCYQVLFHNQSLIIWDSGDSNLKNVEIQMDSGSKIDFTKFIIDQSKRWEKKSPSIFEALLKLLLSALIRQAKTFTGKDEVTIHKEDILDETLDNVELDYDNNHSNYKDDGGMSDDNLAADLHNDPTDSIQDHAPIQVIAADEAGDLETNPSSVFKHTQEEDSKTKIKQELKDIFAAGKSSTPISQKLPKPTPMISSSDCYLDIMPASVSLKAENQNEPEKNLKCDDCGRMYAFRSKLNRHIKSTHMKIRDYACNICKKEFACLSHIKNHMRVHHATEEVVEGDYSSLKKERDDRNSRHCTDCNIWFDNSNDLVTHVVDNHPTRPDLLPFKIRRSGPLPWTRAQCWEREDWTCPLCTEDPIYKADGLSGLVSHCRVIHSDRLICWVCGITFPSSEGEQVYKHMLKEHPLKAVQACKVCGVYNQTKKLYASHMKVHRMESLDGSSMFQCSKCAYSTHRPDNFASHRSMHKKMEESEGMTFVCDECGNVFKTKLSLKNHVRSQHKNENSQTFECKECHKVFLQRHNLLQHMLIHGDEKGYSCEFCPQSFATPSTLIKHRQRNHWVQMGILPKHTCDQCDKRFWQPGELKEHVDRVHLGLKNFVCTECGNRFGSRKVLSKHLRRIHKIAGGTGGIKIDKMNVVPVLE